MFKVILANKVNTHMSSILSGTGAKGADAFKGLYNLWFDKKPEYLENLKKKEINLVRMSSILNGARAKAADAFKDLYDLWFDDNGKKTKYLTNLEKEGIDLVNIISNLSRAQAKAKDASKGSHDEEERRSLEESNSQAEEQSLLPEENDFAITEDNVLIDEDSLKKYTLEELKKELKKDREIEYKPGIEAESKGGIYKNNVEKGKPKIWIAQVAALKGEKNWGVFAKDKIQAGTFLGTYAGERVTQTDNLKSLYGFNVGKRILVDGEKKRNWAGYLNHGLINTANLEVFTKVLYGKKQITFYTKVDISPNSQLLFNYGKNYFSNLNDYKPIYLHPTDNDQTPSQRYNGVKDIYYNRVIELDKEIVQDLGYSGEKYFVVPKLFEEIYSEKSISGDNTLSEGLNIPIYAVNLNREKNGNFMIMISNNK